MTPLNHQWQAARQQRQATAAQRRQQVHTALGSWHQERLANTAQLRQALSQMYVNLQDENALWLVQTRQRRLVQTRQLRRKLATDQRNLGAAVSSLRFEISQDLDRIRRRVEAICQETAVIRAGYRQEHAMLRSQLLPELEAYVSTLKLEVAETLNTITSDRLAAAGPRQEQRQQERQALANEVEAMFHELNDFRQELRKFREGLTEQIWGEETAAPASPVESLAAASPTAQPPAAQPIAAKPQPRRSVAPKASTPAAAPAPDIKAPIAASTPATVADSMPIPVMAAVATLEPPTVTAKGDPIEESVYNYLHKTQGARLTEIESELGINRFQAVDALRSLIQKELIVQEDRIYHVQEEAIL
ncbi:MAG TPA: hypothetical protein V6D29_11915 [Leptolyngbyaceae cyanobacterium]